MSKLAVKEFFDSATWTLTFVAFDEKTKDAVIIDPVLDYDPGASKVSTESVAEVVAFVKKQGLKVHYILETHAHADHLSSSQILKKEFPMAKLAIGERIRDVQKLFKGVFGLGENFATDGSQFDQLLKDGQEIVAGALKIKTLFTPGHTPACASYLINDESLFTGDALFMPDYGTGRCDFPAGSAETLYDSVTQRIYSLPDHVKIYVGHDYMPGGRSVEFQSTVGEEKRKNIQLKAETAKAEFIAFRTERDKTLAAPRLLLPSVQVNIDAGNLPVVSDNGTRYLKIPIRGL
ncbi:MAG: MBL fold metallo-hydrolase [Bdellovibrionales bacterium]|nr:MBL fold metallo-hydrolase [Bdellovibrionales bacterium]